MNKDKIAIVSSDNNPMYLDFWEVVRDMWIRIGIKPLLVHICDKDEIIENNDFIIHKVKKIENVDTGFQSQIIRMYISKYYKNNILITSDIDMIPLSKTYFHSFDNLISENNILLLSSDAYPHINRRFPICYNIAYGKIFSDIIENDVSFSDYTKRLLSMNKGWDTDELYFGEKIYQFNGNIKYLNRGWTYGRAINRIDRVFWNYDENEKDKYIDCHSLRPYSKYINEIKKLINIYND